MSPLIDAVIMPTVIELLWSVLGLVISLELARRYPLWHIGVVLSVVTLTLLGAKLVSVVTLTLLGAKLVGLIP